MTYLESEEKRVASEMKMSKMRGVEMDKRFVWAMILLVGLIANQLCGSQVHCPNCDGVIEIEVQAREIPGWGWRCDNCNNYQSGLSYCTMCGYPRYKK